MSSSSAFEVGSVSSKTHFSDFDTIKQIMHQCKSNREKERFIGFSKFAEYFKKE